MRRGGGKGKGSSFERQVCKALSLWVSGGSQEDLFWRSAMSGGRSTVALKQGKKLGSQAGDISSIHSAGHEFVETFIIECKFYKSLNYDSLIKGNGNLHKFWERNKQDAATYGKLPILIGKQNHFPTMVCLSEAAMEKLRIKAYDAHFQNADMFLIEMGRFLSLRTPFNKKKRIRL